MAAALLSLYFRITFIVCWICLVSAQDEGQFIYEGFNEAKLQMDGGAWIHQNGLLQLTNTSDIQRGYAFHPSPIKFNISSSQSLSFSTNFVVSINPEEPINGGHGMAFVIAPSMDFSGAESGSYLGLFNTSNNGQSTNNILAVELDTVLTPEFEDNGNHVGIDVNNLISNDSAGATYFSDTEGKNISFDLESENVIEVWIDYRGVEKLLNVTIAPNGLQKPTRPLLSTSIDLSQILLDSMYVGFSAATGTRASDHYILGWSFNTRGQAQNLDKSKLPTPPPLRKASKKFEESTIIIVVVVAVVVILIIIGGAVYIVRKKKYEEVYEDWERDYGPQRISYKDLFKATKGFNDEEIIGEGGFGKVYRGVLPTSDVQVAVKRVSSHDSGQGMKQFLAEIVSMGKLRHRNLVQLRGYCRRKGELLLAYDFMPNGSLDKVLYSNIRPNLNWFQRFRIIKGVASALLYLHEEWEQVVLHRDIKPANVLLDAELNGKLGDFGLARLHDHGSLPEETNVAGTVGYVAPELIRNGQATTNTDVFAFGAFMLEVACGRRPIVLGKVDLVILVLDYWNRGAILDASDPRFEGIYVEEQMELVLKLGLFCSHPDPATRPSMRQVVQYLDDEANLSDIHLNSDMIDIFKASSIGSSSSISFSSLLESSTSQTLPTTMASIHEVR